MISIEEARELVVKNTSFIERKSIISTSQALNHLIAENIFSPVNLPPFNQANINGFAVRFPANEHDEYFVIDEIRAGNTFRKKLKPGEAVRVYVGGYVPNDADAIVANANAEIKEQQLKVKPELIKYGDHINRKSSQLEKAFLAIKEKTLLTPEAIGLACTMGFNELPVYEKPQIAIIEVGNELQVIGEELEPGKVYDATSHSLVAVITNSGLDVNSAVMIGDIRTEIRRVLKKELKKSDMIILSGGICEGRYYNIEEILTELNIVAILNKEVQSPGKQLYFGKLDDKLIFGIPGNYLSALTCFQEYIWPALNIMQGKQNSQFNYNNTNQANSPKSIA